MSLDLLFGSPQVWSPTIPAIGYTQPPISPGRVFGPLMPPTALQPPYNAGVQAAMSTVVNPASLSEPAGGVTAAALLAAVAVRRGQPLGPTSDQEIEDFISDALDLLPGSSDIEVRCDGGRATLTGQVSHKRLKRDAGEIAWTIPSVNDVQNNVTIVPRRRSRPMREADSPVVAGRKQA
jgi:BON domain